MTNRRQMPPPSVSPETDTPDNKWRNFLLVAVGIVSLLVILQQFGILKSIDRQHHLADLDVRSAEYQNRPMPQRRPQRSNAQVNATLSEIADVFEGSVFSDVATANIEKGLGLTNDEARYFDILRQNHKDDKSNWLGRVQQSYGIYQKTYNIFGGVEPTTALKNPQKAQQIYTEIEALFGIPKATTAAFAQSAEAQLFSDWAIFIDTRGR